MSDDLISMSPWNNSRNSNCFATCISSVASVSLTLKVTNTKESVITIVFLLLRVFVIPSKVCCRSCDWTHDVLHHEVINHCYFMYFSLHRSLLSRFDCIHHPSLCKSIYLQCLAKIEWEQFVLMITITAWRAVTIFKELWSICQLSLQSYNIII